MGERHARAVYSGTSACVGSFLRYDWENMPIYDYPEYYEIAFSYRDIPAETNFIEEVVGRYSRIPLRTVLELASGNSPHLEELCRRGYEYVGIDLNDEMIDYVRDRIARLNIPASIVKADMIDFSFPEPVDCACVFLGSFYVTSDGDLEMHLASVAGVLRSGGLYILDAAVGYFPEDMRTQSWDESSNGINVHATYAPHWIDQEHGLLKSTITLDVEDHGKTQRIQHAELRKIFSFKQFIQRIQATDTWEYIGSFSDFDIEAGPWEQGRNLTVIRRR
ncbi:MAG TPA: class I SAM-dependent methyltransferase [Terriglobia bacterium]|nr:class I SAM-dependent methyltransferase [Terriglobia bacterium]